MKCAFLTDDLWAVIVCSLKGGDVLRRYCCSGELLDNKKNGKCSNYKTKEEFAIENKGW